VRNRVLWLLMWTALAGTPWLRAQTYTILHKFNVVRGANPVAGVIMDSTGNLYGTTALGGNANFGVVYKVTPSGMLTLLHNFSGGADGASPLSGLVRDPADNLYGTAPRGGLTTGICAPAGCGVVYEINKASKQTVLYRFTGGNDGGVPVGSLILDPAGNLYGTTEFGGAGGQGVVFKLDTAGHETVLYNFTGGSDGGAPLAGLVRDGVGNLYGTTANGGNAGGVCAKATLIPGCGVVFKLDPTNTETVLYRFTGGPDGGVPSASLTLDASGNLYGATLGGGISSGPCAVLPNSIPGCGVLFELSGSSYHVRYAFTGGTDGAKPAAALTLDGAGNLYGATVYGGMTTGACGSSGCGVVFELNTTFEQSVLHTFFGRDGASSYAVLFSDSAGNFYGTAYGGGQSSGGGSGVVFKLTP